MEEYGLSASISMADALIAATAMENHEALLMGNDKHYNRVKELTVQRFRPKGKPAMFDEDLTPQERAQELFYDAMTSGGDEAKIKQLCEQALEIYPRCVDAMIVLAQLEEMRLRDYVGAMREAVAAGRADLGSDYFENEKGYFWGLIETRPFMRAMQELATALLDWGEPERVDEAIEVQEEMLELNPNDNQGMRDVLAACYLQRKRYDDAGNLLKRYEKDWMATMWWARVLLAHAIGDDEEAASVLKAARKQNPYVQQYLTGQKRRPRKRTDYYSPGEETEAVYCADTLWAAWKAHPKSRRWLKDVCIAASDG